MQYLRLERLRYAWRMYHNTPPQLKALVAEARGGKRTWSNKLEADFMAEQGGTACHQETTRRPMGANLENHQHDLGRRVEGHHQIC